MQGAFYFGDELLGSPAEDQGACLGGGTVFEEVEALTADLSLFEGPAGSEVVGLDVGAGRLDGAACGLDDALEIVGGHAAGAEDVSVCEVLCS